MEAAWARDKRLVDRYNAQISALVATVPGLLVREASIQADQREATDMFVFKRHIACRVRKFRHYQRYKHQFTMRCSRQSGAETELLKVASGYGDFLFYGFADALGANLYAASVFDLKVFRREYNLELLAIANAYLTKGDYQKQVRWDTGTNADGSSEFLAFDIDSFPPDLIVAQWPANHHRTSHDGINWAELFANEAPMLRVL
jgi:hypothetical protein